MKRRNIMHNLDRCATALRHAGLALAAALLPMAAAAVPDTMAQRLLACTICHGAQGRATPDGYFPRLAGKPADYLDEQLLAFRDGRRQHGAMARLLADLPDDYLREMAAHFSALDLPYPPPAAPRGTAAERAQGEQLVRQGDPARRLPACASCHGERLAGRLPAMPALTGLSADYLQAQLGGWRNGTRQARAPDCMAAVVRLLRDDELQAIAAYLASQPADPRSMKPDAPATAPLPLACGGVGP
jgi:cytochrome c553